MKPDAHSAGGAGSAYLAPLQTMPGNRPAKPPGGEAAAYYSGHPAHPSMPMQQQPYPTLHSSAYGQPSHVAMDHFPQQPSRLETKPPLPSIEAQAASLGGYYGPPDASPVGGWSNPFADR